MIQFLHISFISLLLYFLLYFENMIFVRKSTDSQKSQEQQILSILSQECIFWYLKQINLKQQIKIQKMKQISPVHGTAEKQFNFKVKVNYNNGAVTVHGPHLNIPAHQVNPPITNTVYSPILYPNNIKVLPQIPTQYPISTNRIIPTSPSFSISTASQSQPQKDFNKFVKFEQDKFVFKPNIVQHSSATQLIRKQSRQNQAPQKITNLNIEIQNQPSIDCVICERKFNKKDFDYHLQLHKNPKRKPSSQPVPTFPVQSTKINLIPPNQNDISNIPNQSQQQIIGQSFREQSKPQMLYSFENKNINAINKSQSSQNQRSHQHSRGSGQAININYSNILPISNSNQAPRQSIQIQVPSHHSSLINSSIKSVNSSMNSMNRKRVQNNIPPQSGIRYMTTPTQMKNPPIILNQSLLSSRHSQAMPLHPPSQVAFQQPIMVNSSQPIRSPLMINQPQLMSRRTPSMKSSQMSQSYMSNRAMQQNMSNSRMNQFSRQQMVGSPTNFLTHNGVQVNPQIKHIVPDQLTALNPFHQMQQQQSKIYQYFPDSGHLSLSQHRVHTTNDANYRSFREPIGFFKQNQQRDLNDIFRRRKTQQNDDFRQIRSQCSESSISSIRSDKQPIQNLNKDQLVKTYHNRRNKLNLSNIIGMSEALAREGYTSKSTTKQILSMQSSHTKVRNLAAEQRQRKTMAANSTQLKQQDKSIYLQHNLNQNQISQVSQYQPQPINNLQMIPIQGRQIYRGIQVQQQDIRAHDSLLNATISSKSSAKTKLPRNYLAVNDFIVNNKI